MRSWVPRFVSAQPDTPWFVWQTHVYLQNFVGLGIAGDRITVLFSVEPGSETTPELVALQKQFPTVDIRVFADERDERGRKYEPSIQPHLIEQWLRAAPEHIGEITMFHDSDIVLRWLPDFETMRREHPDACLLSDADRYIGYDYLHTACEKIREERPDVAEDDLIDRMCAIVGIERAIVHSHQGASGGAQYLLAGLGPDYWAKVYADSLALRELFDDYATELQLEHESGHYLQVWTAGMWSYLWNLWAGGHKTVVHSGLEFLFGAADLDDTSPFLHMAGKTQPHESGRFDKVDWHGFNPIEAVKVQPYVFDHHDEGSVADAYGQAIRTAAGVADRGRCPLRPARHWRILSWCLDRQELWDVERLHFGFDEDVEIIEYHSSGSAGSGYEAEHAFDENPQFWGGRAERRPGTRPEMYLGVKLDRMATPSIITLNPAPTKHRSRMVLVQCSDDGAEWCSVFATPLSADDGTQTILYRSSQTVRAHAWRLVADTTHHDFAWDVSRLRFLVDGSEQKPQLSASGDAGPGFGVDNVRATDGAWGGRSDEQGRFYITASDPAGLPLDRIVLEQGHDHWAPAVMLERSDDGQQWHSVRRFDELAPGRNELFVYEQPPVWKQPRTAPTAAAQDAVAESLGDPFADRRVLVTIAAYRDPDVANTVASALAQAAYPEHVRFAICHQFDPQTQSVLDQWNDDPRFSIDAVPHEQSQGCCWARHRTFEQYDDEPYLLQVDAHTRFAARWDVRFIEMLESTSADLPLLTTYPPSFSISPAGEIEYDLKVGVQSLYIEQLRDNLTTFQKTEVVRDLSAPGPSPTIAAGQIFTRGRFCRDVPYDPQLYFGGEEINLAARAYTNGYDLFYPNENLIWHLYGHDQPKHWDDHSDHTDRDRQAIDRLRTLFQGDHRSLGRYGLGSVRPLASFERHAGIRLRQSLRDDDTLTIEIDQAVVESRDDYDAFVVVLLDAHGSEITRREIRDPAVLNRSRSVVKMRDFGDDLQRAVEYLIVPTQRNGTIGEVVLRSI